MVFVGGTMYNTGAEVEMKHLGTEHALITAAIYTQSILSAQ